MSGPTKADLERRIQQLERELEIAQEQISDLLDGAEWDQYKLKINDDERKATSTEAHTLSDAKLEAQYKLAKRNTGVDGINKDAPARTERIKEYFRGYRAEGHNLTNARDLANNDLFNSEFKYRYEIRWLEKNLKD
jgi:chromosome segregation ATPase